MQTAFTEIAAERARQDAQWGGPAHDDTHDAVAWLSLIDHQMDRAGDECYETFDPALVRARLVKIAALAIAGIQSIDRLAPAAAPALEPRGEAL